MCCHEMNHLHAIIRYHFFDFDVCVVFFNVSYIESFYEKYLMFGKSKILCMSFSVIETYDQKLDLKIASDLSDSTLRSILQTDLD